MWWIQLIRHEIYQLHYISKFLKLWQKCGVSLFFLNLIERLICLKKVNLSYIKCSFFFILSYVLILNKNGCFVLFFVIFFPELSKNFLSLTQLSIYLASYFVSMRRINIWAAIMILWFDSTMSFEISGYEKNLNIPEAVRKVWLHIFFHIIQE